jgi:hypothetical protein
MYGALGYIINSQWKEATFDIPYSSTVDRKGEKTITMKTTGNDKNRFTVMLAVTADGQKLTPYVVFKRKTMPKEIFNKRCI